MKLFSTILRLISLSILFAGSASIVFAAVTLVKAATAQGVPVAQAAANNAPIFIHYARVALGASIFLLFSEGLSVALNSSRTMLTKARYASSLLCVAAVMIFSLGITPAMEQLQPAIATDEKAHAEFTKLHESSRIVFGASIFLALVSLLLPAFEQAGQAKTTETAQ
jgi:hypothetical protein